MGLWSGVGLGTLHTPRHIVGGERVRTQARERYTHHTPVCSYSLRRILQAMIPQQRVIPRHRVPETSAYRTYPSRFLLITCIYIYISLSQSVQLQQASCPSKLPQCPSSEDRWFERKQFFTWTLPNWIIIDLQFKLKIHQTLRYLHVYRSRACAN